MSELDKDYVSTKLNPFLKEIVTALLLKKPDEPLKFLKR